MGWVRELQPKAAKKHITWTNSVIWVSALQWDYSINIKFPWWYRSYTKKKIPSSLVPTSSRQRKNKCISFLNSATRRRKEEQRKNSGGKILATAKIRVMDWIAAPSPIHDVPNPSIAECAYGIYHVQYLSTKLFLQNTYFIQFLSAKFLFIIHSFLEFLLLRTYHMGCF